MDSNLNFYFFLKKWLNIKCKRKERWIVSILHEMYAMVHFFEVYLELCGFFKAVGVWYKFWLDQRLQLVFFFSLSTSIFIHGYNIWLTSYLELHYHSSNFLKWCSLAAYNGNRDSWVNYNFVFSIGRYILFHRTEVQYTRKKLILWSCLILHFFL